MYIILRLVCENFNSIAVEISFLRGPKNGVYAAALYLANVTSGCSRNDTEIVTSVILYIDIIYIAQWLFGGNSEILHQSDVFLHAIRNFLIQKALSSKRVSTFLPRKYDVISQVRHSYAKGPFWVARLIYGMTFFKKYFVRTFFIDDRTVLSLFMPCSHTCSQLSLMSSTDMTYGLCRPLMNGVNPLLLTDMANEMPPPPPPRDPRVIPVKCDLLTIVVLSTKPIKEWVSFFLGSWGMNRSTGQTNRVNREAVLGRFVCSALRFIPHEHRKKTLIPYIYNASNEGPFLKFSEKNYKFKISTVTGS